MVKGLSRLEAILISAFSWGIHKLADDLPYSPCIFFFGEPEYPSDKQE